MAEFVRAQIFGTTFEITSRYAGSQRRGSASSLTWAGTLIFNQSAWAHLASSGIIPLLSVWYSEGTDSFAQLGQGSAYGTECRRKEDYETLQHPSFV